MKTDVNVHLKSKRQENFEKKNIFFVSILSATAEKSRIRIRKSGVLIRGSGSVPKCHGSTTMVTRPHLHTWSVGYNEFYLFLENKEYRPFDGCKIEI
jgi:hypothetical protein